MQPRRLLAFAARVHCWLMLSCSSSGIPRSFSAELLCGQWAPSMIPTVWLHHRLSSPRDLLSSTLSFLEISSTSGTGPRVLQGHQEQQTPLLPGLHTQACFSLALGTAAFALFVGNSSTILLPPDLHSGMALLGSKAFPHKGSHVWVPGFHVTSLPLALVPHLRSCSPNGHQSPQPGAQTGRAPCAITEPCHEWNKS